MSSILPDRRAEAAARSGEAACPKCGAAPGQHCAGVFSAHYARAKAWAEANGATGRVSRNAHQFELAEILTAAVQCDCAECGAGPGEPCAERESRTPWRMARCVPGAVHKRRFTAGMRSCGGRPGSPRCDTPADLIELTGERS